MKTYRSFLVALLLFGTASVWAVDWAYENVDGWNIDMTQPSMMLDQDGWPHVVYRDNSNGSLKYAYRDSTGWHLYTVQSGLNAYWPSLALDTAGFAHIAYKTTSGGNMLRYSQQDASGWYHAIVHQSSGANIGTFPALVLDGFLRPHIAYKADLGSGSNYVYYAYRDTAGVWHLSRAADNPAETGGDRGGIGLRFDSYGEPHIVFFNTSGHMIHAWREGAYVGWRWETAVSNTGIGNWLRMRMVGSTVHVSYNHENSGQCRYAKRTTGWTDEVASTLTGDYPSIAIDNGGHPHISFGWVNGDNRVMYSQKTSSGWSTQTVFYAGTRTHTSIDLNEVDEPHIAAWCYARSGSDYRLKVFQPLGYGPRAFTLLSPSNSAWANTRPLFRWQQCAYRGDSLLRYELWVDGAFNKSVSKTQPYAVPDNPLSSGLHTWRVKAFKINGDSILSTESWSVRVDPNPPGPFGLTSPASGVWTNRRTPTFSWQASSDPESGLRKYRIYAGGGLVNDSVAATLTTGQPVWQLPDGIHSWYVTAMDNVGNERQSSQTWTIKIDSTPPVYFYLVSPLSYAWTADSCPTFKWRRTTDAGIGLSHYQLWIYTTAWTLWMDSIPQGASETLSVTVPTSRPLSNGTRSWYIKALDSLGNAYSTGSRTLYVDLLPPNAFSLRRPRNDSIMSIPKPVFHWQRTTDAGIGGIRYELWVDSVRNVMGLPDTFTAPSGPLAEGRRRWFVLAKDSLGWTRKSTETWTAILDWNPPDTFSLVSPRNNDTVTPLPTLVWRRSADQGSGLRKYQLWVDGILNRDSVSPTETTATPSAPLSPGVHNWFVKALDHAGGVTSSNQTWSVYVAVADVGVTQIIAPSGTVDSGTVVSPSARVRNYGNMRVSFPVMFRIGTFYADTQNVTNLNPSDSLAVSFRDWTATQRGTHATKCTTALTGDVNPANNSQTGSVTVRVTDVGVTQIVAPTGTVDSGAAVVPVSRVQNFGTATDSFTVKFRIGTAYVQTRNKTLAAGANDTVNFPVWTAVQRGTYVTCCSTLLAGDQVPANNSLTDSVAVRVLDVGCTRIMAPTGTIDSCTVVTPACSVYNYGSTIVTYPVRMKIGSGYNQCATVASHAPGAPAYVTFPTWTAAPRGTFSVSCSTELSGDLHPGNNRQTGSVTVRVIDVAALQILAPADTVDSGAVEIPRAKVANYGTASAVFSVTMSVGTWTWTVSDTLAAGASDTVAFAPCTLRVVGIIPTTCSTYIAGDMAPGNNVVHDSVYVRPWTGIASGEEVVGLARQFALHGILPNPVKRSAVVRYSLGSKCHSLVSVFDVRGSLVRELVDADEGPGRREVTWDRRDDCGRWVTSGVYFCRLVAAEFRDTRKLLLVE